MFLGLSVDTVAQLLVAGATVLLVVLTFFLWLTGELQRRGLTRPALELECSNTMLQVTNKGGGAAFHVVAIGHSGPPAARRFSKILPLLGPGQTENIKVDELPKVHPNLPEIEWLAYCADLYGRWYVFPGGNLSKLPEGDRVLSVRGLSQLAKRNADLHPAQRLPLFQIGGWLVSRWQAVVAAMLAIAVALVVIDTSTGEPLRFLEGGDASRPNFIVTFGQFGIPCDAAADANAANRACILSVRFDNRGGRGTAEVRLEIQTSRNFPLTCQTNLPVTDGGQSAWGDCPVEVPQGQLLNPPPSGQVVDERAP
jgi:hypothetical protein